jgi:NDP-sugar pyrophosphorylase family protein
VAASCLNDIDTVVLAGGLGIRIKDALGDTPKLLASIGDIPFLDTIVNRLKLSGARRVILGLGHLADRVVDYLETRPADGLFTGINIITEIESEPLGTAGALRFLGPRIETDPVLVMNGDSFFDSDLCDFVRAHEKSGMIASILCARVEDTSSYGRVVISPEGNIDAFLEKDPDLAGPGIINAGVYLFSGQMMKRIGGMEGPSLETDVFEALPAGTLHAVTSNGAFIDIGTPEDLARAAEVLKPFSPA